MNPIKKLILASATLALALAPAARADSSNGDMSDRGGDSFEMLSNQSWGGIDPSDGAFFEHFFGSDWPCILLGQCVSLPVPTPPIPEPATWVLWVVGLGAIIVWRCFK